VERRKEDKDIKREARAALRKECQCSQMCDPFTTGQLKGALRKLKAGKSAGADDIHNEMLKKLPLCMVSTLLSLFNDSWSKGDCPVDWRTATIIPILKPRKPADSPGSYRPVSLTSCVAKVMERLVADRLSYYLESNNLLAPCQAGFRRGRSTEEQIARVCQDIFDGLESKNHERSVLCLLDFSRAYDKVWKDGLYVKMDRLGVPPCMIRWIIGFLSDRRARVTWNGTLSYQKVFREGLPQGSVLAPLLWLIYINDLADEVSAAALESGLSLFADDSAILASAPNMDDCGIILQPALDAVARWCRKWKVRLSTEKCCYATFTLDPLEDNGKRRVDLNIEGTPLP
jgi:hypothetical protein